MGDLPPALRIILIGGTSHVGKSTLARHLASTLGWEYRAPDSLARHPGRPWRNDGTDLPPHVAEHYTALSVDDLLADVLWHYEKNVLPQIDALLSAHTSDPSAGRLVLEGSAIWPDFVASFAADQVAALWLTASNALLTKRIHAESRYAQRAAQEQLLISKFIERTLAFGKRMERAIETHQLPSIRVREGDTAELLAHRCLQTVSSR